MAKRPQIMVIGGTRPEAIKLAPVVLALRQVPDAFDVKLVSTGQHDVMFREVLTTFGLTPDVELHASWPTNNLTTAVGLAVSNVGELLKAEPPDWVVVQGDTTSAFAAALAAFYSLIPVAHVEAGLRSGDRHSPFPEEMNTRVITRLANLHFAPTAEARDRLLEEGIPRVAVRLTGNTIVDALDCARRGSQTTNRIIRDLPTGRRIILASAHRREHFGEPLAHICNALRRLIDRNETFHLYYSLHENPLARDPAVRILSNHQRITLVPHIPYPDFVHLMMAADLIITDSSGIQEEAPSLSKPVLVLRDETERSEGVHAGVAKLVGVREDCILQAAQHLLTDRATYEQMASGSNPYGDGRAAQRIAHILATITSERTVPTPIAADAALVELHTSYSF